VKARPAPPPGIDPRLPAMIELIGRTGASEFKLQHCDEEPPTVWIARSLYEDGRAECAAAMDPSAAVMRLAERLVDGGLCTHCGKPSGFSAEFEGLPLPEAVCWYAFDPELDTFRRGCEGDAV
jgi:hypothetical protein